MYVCMPKGMCGLGDKQVEKQYARSRYIKNILSLLLRNILSIIKNGTISNSCVQNIIVISIIRLTNDYTENNTRRFFQRARPTQ